MKKDIETYGLVKITAKGEEFLQQPSSFLMTEDHTYTDRRKPIIAAPKDVVNDTSLKNLLVKLRKKIADKNEVPPYTVFQENSINDMTLKYPITIDEMINIHGVGEGKAKKHGPAFIELIKQYVEENNITRPDDILVKSTGANSGLKLYMIQSVDRKLPLDDIASAKGMSMADFIHEMETIVFAGKN